MAVVEVDGSCSFLSDPQVDVEDRVSSAESFAYLRRNRAAAHKAQQLGEYLTLLMDPRVMQRYPWAYNEIMTNKHENEFSAAYYLERGMIGNLKDPASLTEQVASTKPTKTDEYDFASVRRRLSGCVQLVDPGSSLDTNAFRSREVLASVDERGQLYGPLAVMPVTIDFVEHVDTVLVEHVSRLDVPVPGRLTL